ncbi:hypothetical protein CC86DRAFT_374136 [Ophiobolus disseminans]|uniref:Ubiquitin-like protease family profile domain-containing protein n=1 Tax=Ophiobolus disseminans TaxID=1469910 RepID=A0A6A6ZIH0_9PLEO|nr:hypothetical protein CC86DRAFT_374136 [Ophiobolus disseminans]
MHAKNEKKLTKSSLSARTPDAPPAHPPCRRAIPPPCTDMTSRTASPAIAVHRFQASLYARLTDEEILINYGSILTQYPQYRATFLASLDAYALGIIEPIRNHAFKSNANAHADYNYLLERGRWRLTFQDLDISFCCDWTTAVFLKALRRVETHTSASFAEVVQLVEAERRRRRHNKYKASQVTAVCQSLRQEEQRAWQEETAQAQSEEPSVAFDTVPSSPSIEVARKQPAPLSSSPSSDGLFVGQGSDIDGSDMLHEKVELASELQHLESGVLTLKEDEQKSSDLSMHLTSPRNSTTTLPTAVSLASSSEAGPSTSYITTIIDDLRPEQRLRGITIAELLRTFLPRSVARMFNPSDPEHIIQQVTSGLKHGLPGEVAVIAYVCISLHWFGVVYNPKTRTVSRLDSLVDHVSEEEAAACQNSFLQSIREYAGDDDGPIDDGTLQLPQQDNAYDCGVYLVVSFLRMVASSDVSESICGAFYRALFTNFLQVVDDETKFKGLPFLEQPEGNAGEPLVSSLKRERAHLKKLQAFHSAAPSALTLFSNLTAVLKKTMARLGHNIDDTTSLLSQLPNTRGIFHGFARSQLLAHDEYAKALAHLLQRLQREQDAIKKANRAAHRMTSILTGITSALPARISLTRSAISMAEEEVKADIKLKRKREERINIEREDLAKKMRMLEEERSLIEIELGSLEAVV